MTTPMRCALALLWAVTACDDGPNREPEPGKPRSPSNAPIHEEQGPDPTDSADPDDMPPDMLGGQTGGGCDSRWRTACDQSGAWDDDGGVAASTCLELWTEHMARTDNERWTVTASICEPLIDEGRQLGHTCRCEGTAGSSGWGPNPRCGECAYMSAGGRCLAGDPRVRERDDWKCEPTDPEACKDLCELIAELHNESAGLETTLLATSCGTGAEWGCLAWTREGDACYVLDEWRTRSLELPCQTPAEEAFGLYWGSDTEDDGGT